MAKRRQEDAENAWGMPQVDELNSTRYQETEKKKYQSSVTLSFKKIGMTSTMNG